MPSIRTQTLWILLHLIWENARIEPEVDCLEVGREVAHQDTELSHVRHVNLVHMTQSLSFGNTHTALHQLIPPFVDFPLGVVIEL